MNLVVKLFLFSPSYRKTLEDSSFRKPSAINRNFSKYLESLNNFVFLVLNNKSLGLWVFIAVSEQAKSEKEWEEKRRNFLIKSREHVLLYLLYACCWCKLPNLIHNYYAGKTQLVKNITRGKLFFVFSQGEVFCLVSWATI